MSDIQSLSVENYEIAVEVRRIFFNSAPTLSEEIKYGGLVFFKADVLVGGIFFYKQHISIEFSQGATLPDPSSVLEGKGKFRRHIKIRLVDDISEKNVVQYVQVALDS